jgi:hypothetical protein
LKIGGVDPAVLRELSGVYAPFPKAFKELVSNAYDADADVVEIRLSNDFTTLEIYDDGRGLTPDEFRTDFTKVGGSQARAREELTPKQRLKIGSKGIGFLAVARYCSRMDIVSTTVRSNRSAVRCPVRRRRAALLLSIKSPIPPDLLKSRIRIEAIFPIIDNRKQPKIARKYNRLQTDGSIDFSSDYRAAQWQEVEVEYSIDYGDLEFSATIDFDYLLSLENKKDLEAIEDFCTIEVRVLAPKDENLDKHYTRITLCQLKDSVIRYLKGSRKHGNVRNIESRSGLDRFLWHLQRSIPTRYELPEPIHDRFGENNLDTPKIKFINRIRFFGPGGEDVILTRPVWSPENALELCLDDDVCVEVDINQDGLVARGYILGHSEIIFPAEYRGIAVRVRNVQIGESGYLGFENIATGFVKAALSQITGEINVLQGMDAIDSLNPGRESFYEENLHYKVLRKNIVGDKETVGGLLEKVVNGIWKRTQVRSAVEDQLSQAAQRRKALLSVAMAVTHFSRSAGGGLKKLFSETTNLSNGLAMLPEFELGPSSTIQGFRVVKRPGLGNPVTDFMNKKVYVDPTDDRWSRRLSLMGDVYEIVPKAGGEKDPLCQLDLESKAIYVNWGHPLRQLMGEAAFIKSSVAWRIAYHASQGNIENMMELYLKILTYNEL